MNKLPLILATALACSEAPAPQEKREEPSLTLVKHIAETRAKLGASPLCKEFLNELFNFDPDALIFATDSVRTVVAGTDGTLQIISFRMDKNTRKLLLEIQPDEMKKGKFSGILSFDCKDE